jgi:hypothetical protein
LKISKQFDFLIIGQGIAGTMLSFQALKRNKSFLVIDNNHNHSASLISSGVINPVTGRRIVKSWMVEELMEKAIKDYKSIEDILKCPIIKFSSITRLLKDVEEENNWSSKALEESTSYLSSDLNAEKYLNYYKNFRSAGKIEPALVIDIEKLLTEWKNYLILEDNLLSTKIQPEDLQIIDGGVSFNDMFFNKVIFADGHSGISKYYFDFLNYENAKGEVIYIESYEYDLNEMVKSSINVIPTREKEYWVGSNYEWNALNDKPSVEGRNHILNKLSRSATFQYKIKDHKAAIRACTLDRKPYIGSHPEYSQLFLFNGLGTKGISLAPYFSSNLLDHILFEIPLMPEVNLKRLRQ